MKQKLLLALLALFTGVGTLSAQTWTGSEVNEGTYYLYNVGADKFLAYGADWGTRAVIDDVGIPVQLVSNNGTYRIQTNVTGKSGKVFLGADFYIDQDACDFTFTPVANMGEKHVYTLSYMHRDGKTRYRNWVTDAKTFDQVQSVAAGSTWTLESLYWMLISKEERDQLFASGNPMDITYKYIENPNTAWFTGCYTTNNSWQGTGLGGFNGRDADISYRDRNTEHYSKEYNTYIEATDVPDGKYRFSMAGYYRDGTGAQAIQNYKAGTSTLNAKIYANENTTDIQSIGIGMRTSKAWDDANESSAEVEGTTYYVPNGQDVATFYFNEGVYPMQSVDVIVSNGTLRFGMKKETTIASDWTVFDKFRLTYVEPAISAKAVALPKDGAMVAGQWYKITVDKESRYAITADNLGDIVYTTQGNSILLSEDNTVTTTFADNTVILPVGTYYVKASNDNAKIVLNNVEPAIADGYYFLRDSQGRYVGRGSSYNTRALMEPYGLPLYVETNYDGITTFTFIDSNLKLFDAGNGGTVYTDNTTYPNWKVEATDGGYYIINMNENGSYGKKLGTDGGTLMQSNDNGLVWTFEPAAEHNTYMEALKDQQAATAATAAGMEGITDRNSLKAKLESDYAAESVTIDEVAWAEKYQVGAGDEWAGNGVKYYENSISGLKPGLYKLTAKAYYRLTWNEIVDAAAGARSNVYLYGNNAKTQLYSVFDFPANAAWVSGNDYRDAKGKYYPNNPAGSQAALNAGNYETELFVYVSADDDAETGTLNYGIHQPSRFGGNGQWCAYQDFTLTYYSDDNIAKKADYDDLNEAIAAAEEKVLGFEANEYAPYNNVEALAALNAAKNIDQTVQNTIESVQAATAAITNAHWSANAKEVNAFYDGTFANAENNGAPAGWRMSNNTLGGAYHSRAFNPHNNLSEFNETKSGFYMRFDGTNSNRGSMYFYGDTEGYTIPLKANTTYYVKVDFAGWGSTGKPLRMNVTGPEGFTPVSQQYNTTINADTSTDTPQQFNIVFTTKDAGNYVINFQTPGADTNTHAVVISNCELMRAVVLSDDATEAPEAKENAVVSYDRKLLKGWNSLVLPFEVTQEELGIDKTKEGERVLAYGGTTKNGENDYTINFNDVEGNLTANTPYLIKKAADGENMKFTGKSIIEANSLEVTDATNSAYTFVGTYIAKTADDNFIKAGDLTVGASALKKATKAKAIKAFRAFLRVELSEEEAANAKISVNINGNEVDAIEAIEIMNAMSDGIYNLQGQKVNKAQKGIYIVNGKKILKK